MNAREKLRELLTRCEAATPGPWETVTYQTAEADLCEITSQYTEHDCGVVCDSVTQTDAEFIICAREDMPKLLYVARVILVVCARNEGKAWANNLMLLVAHALEGDNE